MTLHCLTMLCVFYENSCMYFIKNLKRSRETDKSYLWEAGAGIDEALVFTRNISFVYCALFGIALKCTCIAYVIKIQLNS